MRKVIVILTLVCCLPTISLAKDKKTDCCEKASKLLENCCEDKQKARTAPVEAECDAGCRLNVVEGYILFNSKTIDKNRSDIKRHEQTLRRLKRQQKIIDGLRNQNIIFAKRVRVLEEVLQDLPEDLVGRADVEQMIISAQQANRDQLDDALRDLWNAFDMRISALEKRVEQLEIIVTDHEDRITSLEDKFFVDMGGSLTAGCYDGLVLSINVDLGMNYRLDDDGDWSIRLGGWGGIGTIGGETGFLHGFSFLLGINFSEDIRFLFGPAYMSSHGSDGRLQNVGILPTVRLEFSINDWFIGGKVQGSQVWDEDGALDTLVTGTFLFGYQF